jgi:hypothetical protein
MDGQPYHRTGVINLENGVGIMDFDITDLPQGKLFVIEFVGVNAFAQPDQSLFFALQVKTNTSGVYPIVLNGESPFDDSVYPARYFGSQQVLLYADPDRTLKITFARHDSSGEARCFFDLSGRIIDPV